VRIALDYDGTYTRDPTLWACFIDLVRDVGHEIVCVTMRDANDPEEAIIGVPCEVIYTSRKGKLAHMAEIGKPVDIWIDDDPRWIMFDTSGLGHIIRESAI